MSMITQDYPFSYTIAAAQSAHGAVIGDKSPIDSAIRHALLTKNFMPQVELALSDIVWSGVLQDGFLVARRSEVRSIYTAHMEEYPRYRESMFWRHVENAFKTFAGVEIRWEDLDKKYTSNISEFMKPKRKSMSEARFFHVLNRDGYACRFCGATDDLTVDHIIPVIKGGTNHLDNLQTLCRTCNSKKGARV